MVMVMGMAAPWPLYVTSPPTAATIRRTMQVPSPSTVGFFSPKTTVIIFFISFCQGAPSHSLYLPPLTTLYPYSPCTEYISIIFHSLVSSPLLLFTQVETHSPFRQHEVRFYSRPRGNRISHWLERLWWLQLPRQHRQQV
ncbi:hypothetical protein FJTKL_11873 [Diaporthe vaccinii]|uniref:Uncharacterized protein n=1 Tax=Diaporthe vaccinii TaxID=105482 RepID=A0ABR4FAC1_9PEZI